MITNWHNLSAQRVVEFLSTDSQKGLSFEEVKTRQQEAGRNLLPKKKSVSQLKLVIEQIRSPLIYVLLIAGIVVFFFGEYTDAVVIFAAVFLNTVIGYIQENKASQALLKLKQIVKHKAKVIREGGVKMIDSSDVVPGDIVILEPGDMVPADGRLIKAEGLKINEMVLTGEWLPTTKQTEELPAKTSLADRENMAYMGTIVEAGRAKLAITAIGQETEIGKIATTVEETKEEKTPYQKKLARFSRLVGIFIGLASLFIFIEGVFTGGNLMEMFITAVAVAIAAIPEGLPVAMTVILALGMQRILKKKGLVRKLVAAETLGSTSVICTDKTATLTQGKIKVTKVITDRAKRDLVYKIAVLCNEAFVENQEKPKAKWLIRGRPTDKALLKFGLEQGYLPAELKKDYQKIDEMPFDNEKKFLATLYKQKGAKKNIVFISGAPEKILELAKLPKKERQRWEKQIKNIASKGFRTIALGFKQTSKSKLAQDIFKDFKFLALLGLSDPLRPDVKKSLKVCRQAGMRPIIVTGDHKLTAKAIAKQLGFRVKEENIMEGSELDDLAEEEFKKRLKNVQIYARVEPKHKMRIIQALQEQGEVVAMTGDGVNDAPALKKADIGVALGSATEVAKETSDLILLNNSFSIIVAAVEQGRAILDNIRKVITYLLSDSFTEVILIGGSIVITKALDQPWFLPLTAVQILWVNLIEDGLPSQALAFEPKEKGLMKQEPAAHKTPLLTREMKVIIFAVGLLTDLMLLALLYWFLVRELDIAYIRTMLFAALSIDSLFYVFSCKSLRRGLWHINPFSNKFLVLSWFFSILALVLAIYLPFFNHLLRTIPLHLYDWLVLIILGLINVFLIELVKHYFIVRHQTSK